ncbi:MAG: LysM peptidoglycan-binding domain-containing protein [Candidatus Marinimicrobia bacterium]|nr:LysM peptidoglycan-binding domain-containing protein [Candidatus Neomarinimicrobiota bacterium]
MTVSKESRGKIMVWIRSYIIILMAVAGYLLSASPVSAQEASSMTAEEYQAEMARWQGREASASSELARINRDIVSLREQLADIDATISEEREEILGLMSASDDEIREYMNMLTSLDADVAALESLSREEILGAVDLLEDLEIRFEDLNENDLANLEQNRELLDNIDETLSNYRTVIPAPSQDTIMAETISEETLDEPEEEISDGETPREITLVRKADSYRVIRGDNLWKISGREQIYNDPFQWLKIYSANRDQIVDPDVIEIDQIFVIPREPAINEHWVSRGESLSKIAAKRYSNPFEWTRIYEANKSILKDADTIHPYTILIIPKKVEKKETSPVNM